MGFDPEEKTYKVLMTLNGHEKLEKLGFYFSEIGSKRNEYYLKRGSELGSRRAGTKGLPPPHEVPTSLVRSEVLGLQMGDEIFGLQRDLLAGFRFLREEEEETYRDRYCTYVVCIAVVFCMLMGFFCIESGLGRVSVESSGLLVLLNWVS
ncbi:hypothetical protein H5410_023006 [Solanum commersonii]|uniref:Transmembrane protein n=1 Tax=Solanum commersonii TaxID=4109 RepID=A0A9J5ZH20_SOLCO|nr:hypothetical protein H5410_023006 [Solanum commersonii]